MNLLTGHYLQNGKYQLSHVVGQGGFGITYKGVLFTEVKGALGTIKTEVPISIKEYFFKDYCYRNQETLTVNVHSENGKVLFNKFKEKLIKEAKILSDVHHPYIVNVLDVFEENNTAYIAMEFIAGHSLKYLLEKEGVLPEKRVLKYIHQIGKALQFVHEKNIVHLDIKPSNILIDQNDNARLIDFGVSKRYDVEEEETSTTMLALSKGFASIEQYDSEGTQTFSPCPDIYSLGATMYNLLTGKTPVESILRATRPLQKPSEYNPDITSKTEEAILKAMEISPAERFRSVQEMLDALELPPPDDVEKRHYTEPANNEDDESTLLYSPSQPLKKEEDNEQTIVSDRIDHSISDRKRKKRIMILSLVCIFALIGSSVALLLGHGKPGSEQIDMPVSAVIQDPEDEPVSNPQTQQATVETPASDKDDTKEKEEPPVTTTTVEPEKDVEDPTKNEQPEIENGVNDKPTESYEQPTEEDINTRYAELMSSGETKMRASDFEGANKDFMDAYSVKPTKEAEELIRESNLKWEDKRIADKLAKYEEKLLFGRMKIVRKTETLKYGAIDDKGEEVIVCKYTDVERADEGYAFIREDGLYDIYNSNGKLLKSVGRY